MEYKRSTKSVGFAGHKPSSIGMSVVRSSCAAAEAVDGADRQTPIAAKQRRGDPELVDGQPLADHGNDDEAWLKRKRR